MIAANGGIATKIQTLPLKLIQCDAGTQARVGTNEEIARDYADALLAGSTFPPPVVFFDSKQQVYFLADGFHTVRGHEIAQLKHVTVYVREGTRRDALLYACSSNTSHGHRRTRADIRHAVLLLLQDPEWSKQSNCWIAEVCQVSEGCVRNYRQELKEAAEEQRRAAFATLPAAYQVTPPPEPTYEREPTPEDRLMQIEALAGRLRRLLGEGDAVEPAMEILAHYLGQLRRGLGLEERHEVVIDKEILGQAKLLVGRMRKLHLELPSSRQATKTLERFLPTLARVGGNGASDQRRTTLTAAAS